jgi:formate C-acetyltransferase
MLLEAPMKRTLELKNNLLTSQRDLCIERARYFTEIYNNNKDDPVVIKKAKAIAETLKKMKIFIRDNEMLVGNETSKNLGEKVAVELYSLNRFKGVDKLNELRTRKVQAFQIHDDEIEELKELVKSWEGLALYDDIIPNKMKNENIIKNLDSISIMAPNIGLMVGTNDGHVSMGYEKILKMGYTGIIKETESFQMTLDKEDPEYEEKYNFYEAVKIYYRAAINFLIRYSELASTIAEEVIDEHKSKLEYIAETLDKLSKGPPETFYDAIQLVWFSQNIANIIYHRSVLALGRLDQTLWPFYEEDLKENRITRKEALELIEELNLKLTWNCTLLPSDYSMIANSLGMNTQTVTISGVDRDGIDATNELSYLFLEAYYNIKAYTSDLSVRIHKDTPKDFFVEAIKVFKSTSGIAFYNDDVHIPAMEKAGYSLEDARNYVIIGCVEPTSEGKSYGATGQMFLNLPGVLELTLNNGVSNFTRQKDGLETGDPSSFTTYEEFFKAFKKQLNFNIERAVRIATIFDEEGAKWNKQPFVSATIENCLETGKDYMEGGAKYNFSSITAYSFGSLVNSMYIIKKAIYEENLMPLHEFIQILNSNYRKQNVLRKKLMNKYEQWGNDQDEIDAFAVELWDLYCQEVAKHKTIRGGRFNPGAYSMGVHVIEGMFTKATPDGRKASQPLSNSISPANNTEKSGVTAVLNSVAKLNYDLATNGVALNVKFHPQNLENEENIEKFYYLLKGYFDKGGMQIQPNVVSSETLREAQQHPEDYLDLIVKVGGYNATFVDLGAPIQTDIINRLEQNL